MANLACVGATPVAVVNCLNFGNPEHPEVMWQLSECIDGMAEACRALSLPVIGGNVSLYNESGGADIDPTPVLGLLGLVEVLHAPPPGLAWHEGDTLVLLGARAAARRLVPPGRDRAGPPSDASTGAGRCRPSTLHGHAAVCAFVAGLVSAIVAGGQRRPVVERRARRVLGRPLAVALAEMAVAAGSGLRGGARRSRRALHRVALALRGGHARCPTSCAARAESLGIPGSVLGRAGGDRVVLGDLVDLPLEVVRQAHEGNLAALLGDS